MNDLSPSAEILRDLIRCPSVTPNEGGALDYLEKRLAKLGFTVTRRVFSKDGTPDVENLYARLGTQSPNLCFAGHTDVVPVGDEGAWKSGPFSGDIVNGEMFGRGAVDMKGGIACFLAAVEEFVESECSIPGSISFLITGDEEGPALNGTSAILDWLVEQGETFDACVVGEPTNPDKLGDAIKIGRRGSLSGTLVVDGVQGHAAYPHLADNPLRGIIPLVHALMHPVFDEGTENFQPTNLEVTSIDAENPAFNVIPAQAKARFNVRFNDLWTADTLQQEILDRLARAASDQTLRPPLEGGERPSVTFRVDWAERPSHVFLTKDDRLIATMADAVKGVTNREPELSTGGGTSDARFIKDVCPVIEFGLVGQTMHQVNERTKLADLDELAEIYAAFLRNYFQLSAA